MHKLRPRGEQGSILFEVLMSLAVGAVVLLGVGVYVSNLAGTTGKATALQVTDHAMNQALNDTSRTVGHAGRILVAGPNELVVEGDGDADGTAVRWVRNGENFYRQVWTGYLGNYNPAKNNWINVSAASGTAPAGAGTQSSDLRLKGVTVSEAFFYFDQKGKRIAVSAPLTGEATEQIARVQTNLNAEVDGVIVASTVATSVDTGHGGAADPDALTGAVICPAVSVELSGTNPVVNFSASSGASTYRITRNGSVVQTQGIAAGQSSASWKDAGVSIPNSNVYAYSVAAVAPDGTTSVGC
ncbi:MAG: hypothetical protein L0G99_14915, partial [Propionibacteriales bacterium]|nr:hypothetical protein [Propionibacteriales bacterium]